MRSIASSNRWNRQQLCRGMASLFGLHRHSDSYNRDHNWQLTAFCKWFACIWPDCLHLANTADNGGWHGNCVVSNLMWSWANQTDTPFLKAMFYVCRFIHDFLTPMGLFSLTSDWMERLQQETQMFIPKSHLVFFCLSTLLLLGECCGENHNSF